jgi:hypothetical protein
MINTWKEQNYAIVRSLLHPQLCSHLNSYLKLQRRTKITLDEHRWLPPKDETYGTFSDPQIKHEKTWCKYGDIAVESLFDIVTPIMNIVTGLDLIPTYGYTRIYAEGAELRRHKDRFSCEISTTINLGGPSWPIYVEPDTSLGYYETDNKNVQTNYHTANTKGVEINLNPGDIMIYRGNLVEHWREPLIGNDAVQCFLHYNDSKTEDAALNAADTRPHLGLPGYFRNGSK